MSNSFWWLRRAEDVPLVATAIHNGHSIREELHGFLALSEEERLREEDPFTGEWTEIAPNRIVVDRSRFEVDLNRARNKAVYRRPEDAWGLHVWNQDLPVTEVRRSLAEYDEFYAGLHAIYRDLAARHGSFVVFDLHSYNHRRSGPDGPAAPQDENPQVNIGTATLTDRHAWGGLIDRFISDLSAFDFPGGRLDVRENVKFRGGNCARWTHETFPGCACVLSVEFKKFFMDEWTGAPVPGQMDAIKKAIHSTFPGVLEEMGSLSHV